MTNQQIDALIDRLMKPVSLALRIRLKQILEVAANAPEDGTRISTARREALEEAAIVAENHEGSDCYCGSTIAEKIRSRM